ncbi:MAG: ABC transporter permease subunit/CPBP intramembrane protease [Peptostreptococcaceae bacterium]
MRTKIILEIFKKEMLDILRDKKSLFMMIILPIILYPLLLVGFSQVLMMSMNSIEKQEITLAFNQSTNNAVLDRFINNQITKDNEGIKIIKSSNYEKDIKDGKLDAYISQEKKDNKLSFKIYSNNSSDKSIVVNDKIVEILDDYKEDLVRSNLEKEGLDYDYILEPITYENIDLAKNEEKAGYLLGQILPFILIMGVLLGAIYPAIDVMAGEKERGTLETLLTLPISNLELIIGKYLSVSFSAIVTALLNIISIFVSLVFMVYTQGVISSSDMSSFNLSSLIGPVIITIICICLFAMVVSALSMCVCSFAKSFKDAQNYITPLMLLIMIPSYASMVPAMKLTPTTSVIPVINISLLIKSVMSFDSNVGLISMVLISNLAFVILSVVVLSKIFNSEDILFGDNKSFSFLEKRSNIKIGTIPSPSDGMILYVLSLLFLIYIGSIIQFKLGMSGIAITQIVILLLPVLFAFYIKSDFKKVFSINLPSFKHILGSVILWAGGYVIVLLVTQILLYFFPSNLEVAESLNDALYIKDSLFLNLLIVAVMPAICEEMLFRGFILTSFNKSKKYPQRAIFFSALLFGFMHIDFIRIVPTTILGIILAYSVYKSGSIFVAMIMHFLNNGVSVIVNYYSQQAGHIASSSIELIPFTQEVILLFIGLILLFIGKYLLSHKNDLSIISK